MYEQMFRDLAPVVPVQRRVAYEAHRVVVRHKVRWDVTTWVWDRQAWRAVRLERRVQQKPAGARSSAPDGPRWSGFTEWTPEQIWTRSGQKPDHGYEAIATGKPVDRKSTRLNS